MGSGSGGGSLSDEFLLDSSRGRVSLPLWRTVNAEEAQAYLFAHLPSELFQQPGA